MDTQKLHFITTGYMPLVKTLLPDASGKWGKMNAQQMAEHVTAFFAVSANRLHFNLVTLEEDLPKYKAFLLSDKQFRENTKAPLTVLGEEPLPLRYSSMEEATDNLQKSINGFVDLFATDKDMTTVHPVFGP